MNQLHRTAGLLLAGIALAAVVTVWTANNGDGSPGSEEVAAEGGELQVADGVCLDRNVQSTTVVELHDRAAQGRTGR